MGLKGTVLIGIMFCTAFSSKAQHTIEYLGSGEYMVGDRLGRLHELRDVFKDDPTSSYFFDQFDKSRRAQRGINKASLWILGGSVAVGSLVILGQQSDDSLGAIAGAVLIFYGGVAALSLITAGAILAGSSKKKWKTKLIDFHNQKQVSSPTSSYLQFEIKGASIGLVFHF